MASRAGSKNIKTQAAKDNTRSFFVRMLSDAAEENLWKRFLESNDEDLAFRAFIRAVEYKRGKPVQPVSTDGEGVVAVIMDAPRPERREQSPTWKN